MFVSPTMKAILFLVVALLQVANSFGLLPTVAKATRWRLGCSMEDAAERIIATGKSNNELMLALEFLSFKRDLQGQQKFDLAETSQPLKVKLVEAFYEKELSFLVQRCVALFMFSDSF